MSQASDRVAPGLADVVKQVQAHLGAAPEGATKVTFRALTRLVEGLTTSARMRDFEVTVDEPENLGGANRGPNPVEVVLAAFGTCQEITYAVHAAALGVRIDKLEIDVDGDLDPRGFFGVSQTTPAGFSNVRYKVRIDSPDPPERVAALVEQVNRHCPVLDVLKRGIPVAGSVDLNGKKLG